MLQRRIDTLGTGPEEGVGAGVYGQAFAGGVDRICGNLSFVVNW